MLKQVLGAECHRGWDMPVDILSAILSANSSPSVMCMHMT